MCMQLTLVHGFLSLATMPAHHFRVVVRVRTIDSQDTACQRYTAPLSGSYGNFTVDQVFEAVSQAEFYQGCVAVHVDTFMQGLSSVILTYGASGAGKSYTVEGPSVRLSGAQDGVVPRAVADIFAQLSSIPKHRYKVLVCACGLSPGPDAAMVDLLSTNAVLGSLKDASAASAWAKATRQPLAIPNDIYKVMSVARLSASRYAKPLHVCFTVQLVGYTATGEQLSSSLSFVDLLAPDARDALGRPSYSDPALSRSLAVGYTTLSAVLGMLRRPTQQQGPGAAKVVPWRNAPLTRWLQQLLSKADEALVIGAVSPAPAAAADTLATLSYVSKLRPGGVRDGVLVTASWDTRNNTDAAGGTPGDTVVGSTRTSRASSPRQRPSPPTTTAAPPLQPAAPWHPQEPHTMQPVDHTPEAQTEASGTTSPAFTFHTPSTAPASVGGLTALTAPPIQSPRGWHTATGLPPTDDRPPPAALLGRVSPTTSATPSDHPGPVRQRSPPHRERERSVEPTALTPRVSPRPTPATSVKAAAGLTLSAAAPASAVLERVIVGLQQQLETAQAQMARYEEERGSFTQEIQKLGEMSVMATKELEWQARESSLEREVAVLRDKITARDTAINGLTVQLAECRQELTEAKAGKEKAELQLQGAAEKLSSQVRALTDETGRLKRRAQEAAAESEREAATRRVLESQVSELQAQLESRRSAAELAQRQLDALSSQVQEANQLLDAARADRKKLQEAKWQSDETVQQLTTELEGARILQQQLDLELKAATSRAQGDVKMVTDQASVLQAELSSATAQYAALKDKVSKLEQVVEAQKRLESTAAHDISEVEAMLREFERDLEVHAPSLWKEMRSERADVHLLAPNRDQLSLHARWRPIFRTLISVIRRQAVEQQHAEQALGVLKAQLQVAASKAVHVDELAASLRSQQSAHLQSVSDLQQLQEQLQQKMDDCEALRLDRDQLSVGYQQLEADMARTQAALAQVRAQYNQAAQELAQANTSLPATLRKVESRDQVLSMVWLEVQHLLSSLSALSYTLDACPSSPSPTQTAQPAPGSPVGPFLQRLMATPSPGSNSRHRAKLGGTLDTAQDTLDLEDTLGQQRVISAVSETRVQVSALIAHLTHCQQSLAHQSQELDRVQRERDELNRSMEGLACELDSVRQKLSALQQSHSALEAAQQATLAEKTKAQEQVTELQGRVAAAEAGRHAAETRLAPSERELADMTEQRDNLKAQVQGLESQVSKVKAELAAVTATAAGEASSRQRAELEAGSQGARVSQLEGQLVDLREQLAASTSRLSATERALAEASGRISELKSKLALTETDARLKVQELTSKLSESENASKVSAALHGDAEKRAAHELKGMEAQLEQAKQDLESMTDERRKAVQEVTSLERSVRELQLQVQDAEFVHKQLQTVLRDKDQLSLEVKQMKHAQTIAAATLHTDMAALRHELDTVRAELQQTAVERLRLAGQLEVAKLGTAVSNALVRSRGAATVGSAAPSPNSRPLLPRSQHAHSAQDANLFSANTVTTSDFTVRTAPDLTTLPGVSSPKVAADIETAIDLIDLATMPDATRTPSAHTSLSLTSRVPAFTGTPGVTASHDRGMFSTPQPTWKAPVSPYSGTLWSPLNPGIIKTQPRGA